MFTPEQLAKLNATLEPSDVKTRKGAGGASVSYVEAWDVIAKLNEIFQFNWDRETEVFEVHDPVPFTPPPTRENPHPKTQVVACYRAKVRLTIWDEAHTRKVVREGCGGSRAFAPTVGEATEQAIKAAESDATKRACATLGWQFGLALYDKQRRFVAANDAPRQLVRVRDRDTQLAPIDDGFDDRGDDRWEEQRDERRDQRSNSERALGKPQPAQVNGNSSLQPTAKTQVRY